MRIGVLKGMCPERRRLTLALLLSLLFHALLLSLTFSGQHLGLPGISFPWHARRIEVPNLPELRAVLTPPPVAAAEPLPSAQNAGVSPTIAAEPAMLTLVDRAPPPPPPATSPPSTVQTAITPPKAKPKKAAKPEAVAATPAVPVATAAPDLPAVSAAPNVSEAAPELAERPIESTSPATPNPDVMALVRSDEATFAVPPAPAEPTPAAPEVPAPIVAAAPSAATSQTATPPVTPPATPPLPDAENAAKALAVEQAKIDAATRDAKRQADRLEAQRQEAERQAAARLDAARQETARQEATRAEAARLETERQETARQLAAQQEAARQEAAQVEAARLEAERKETARQAAARQEAARQDATRQEAARAEAARAEGERQEGERQAATARQEAARQDSARQEVARAEAARMAAKRADEEKREERLRAIGRQLNEEADRRDAAARRDPSASTIRRGRLFGRADANAELVAYAEALSRKIELNMTFDMVREAIKQPHTDPLVTVAVRSDGSVESITFVRPSGVPAIDEAIRRIVQSQANYQAFSPALLREYDVVEIRRTWHFDMAVRLY